MGEGATSISSQCWQVTRPQLLVCSARMESSCPLTALLRRRTVIDQYYRQWFQNPAKVTGFTFSHLESPVLGDAAFDVGTYKQTLLLGNGAVNASGKYAAILKRSDGDWKIAYLIFNGDSPAKMPPTASGSRASVCWAGLRPEMATLQNKVNVAYYFLPKPSEQISTNGPALTLFPPHP